MTVCVFFAHVCVNFQSSFIFLSSRIFRLQKLCTRVHNSRQVHQLVLQEIHVAPQFVDLTADKDALSAMLRRLNMIERDEVPSVSPLTGGVSSNIVRVDTKLGSFCLKQALPMLKVEKEWLAPVERVFVEIAWLRTAAAIAPRNIPRIIAVDNGTGSFLMEFLPPDQYTSWKASLLAGEVKPGIGAQLGFVLNLIHSRTAGNPEVIAEFDNPFNHENFMAIRLDSGPGGILFGSRRIVKHEQAGISPRRHQPEEHIDRP
jgi:hypothetical protein